MRPKPRWEQTRHPDIAHTLRRAGATWRRPNWLSELPRLVAELFIVCLASSRSSGHARRRGTMPARTAVSTSELAERCRAEQHERVRNVVWPALAATAPEGRSEPGCPG